MNDASDSRRDARDGERDTSAGERDAHAEDQDTHAEDQDAQARRAALDVTRSFIVQAPAGSGKTELLIQRFLGLLATVDEPESIVAITFTRKAASEVRQRIFAALSAGAVDTSPESPHQRTTWHLARAALHRDRERGWHLLDHPARLEVKTIDALCAALVRRAPLAAAVGSMPAIVEDARALYREAARRELRAAARTDRSWRVLLDHLDNQADRIVDLLAIMLSRREQWLRHVVVTPFSQLRAALEASLVVEVEQALERARRLAPMALEPALVARIDAAAEYLRAASRDLRVGAQSVDASTTDPCADAEDLDESATNPPTGTENLNASTTDLYTDAEDPDEGTGAAALLQFRIFTPAPTRYLIASHAPWRALPTASAQELPRWRALCDWLLIKDQKKPTLRRRLTKARGFPPQSDAADSATGRLWAAHKEAMEDLLVRLSEHRTFLDALAYIQRLPLPRFDDVEWQTMEALLAILPRTVAQLQLLFAETNSVDFPELMRRALDALGPADAPSDLLLSLDLRISHLLVDEFQDTSYAQYELLQRLTAGWTQGDGRTLFVVGDPMQSIYRFREAEVGLYLRARAEGLGMLTLEPLTLSRNFRSHAGVVAWTNRAFAAVLPQEDDPAIGAVGFYRAIATLPAGETPAVTIDLCRDTAAEARAVVQRILAAKRENADGTVAVLVRARPHLRALWPALREAGLSPQAIDIDELAGRQSIIDLFALTHALLQPADRLAWFALLRAPWCGLTLADLDCIAEATPRGAIVDVLHDLARIEGLSDDGRARILRIIAIVDRAEETFGVAPLARWVRGVWLALGAPACAAMQSDLAAADRFWTLLERHTTGGDCVDWDAFTTAALNLYAEPDPTADDRLQIMTVHKAKGLEFDTVIFAGLAAGEQTGSSDLLRWRDRPPGGLLLAPIQGRRTKVSAPDPIDAYLRFLVSQEEDAELGRKLYVACTRAKRRLHLVGVVKTTDDGGLETPRKNTALAKLWPFVTGAMETNVVTDIHVGSAQANSVGSAVIAEAQAKRAASSAIAETRAYAAAGSMVAEGRSLRRLSLLWPGIPSPLTMPLPVVPARLAAPPIAFDWAREAALAVGTVAHRWLRRIGADVQTSSMTALAVEANPRIAASLSALGISEADLERATVQVTTAIVQALDDPRGRWLFSADHAEARGEYALSAVVDNALTHVVIDRTFVDREGIRWIVDFKLSSHAGSDVEAFLDSERERYRDQLEGYARVLRLTDVRPIRLGLYFPLLRGWRDWDYRD